MNLNLERKANLIILFITIVFSIVAIKNNVFGRYDIAFLYISILLIIIFCKGSIRHRMLDESFDNMYSITCIRGIACSLVVLGHVLGKYIFLAISGHICVGFFFTLSGYGLMHSLLNKQNYLQNFIFRRVFSSLYVPFFMINGLFICLYKYRNPNLSFFSMMKFLFGFDLTNEIYWYVIAIMLFYMLFFICFRYFTIKNGIILYSLSIIVYALLGVLFDIGTSWYISISGLFIGYIYAYYKQFFLGMAKKYFYYFSILSFILFSIFHISIPLYPHDLLPISYNYCITSLEIIETFVFIIFIICLSTKYVIFSPIAYFLGAMSYEMYLIHPLVISLIPSPNLFYNDLIYILVIFITSIISAFFLHKLLLFVKNRLLSISN